MDNGLIECGVNRMRCSYLVTTRSVQVVQVSLPGFVGSRSACLWIIECYRWESEWWTVAESRGC